MTTKEKTDDLLERINEALKVVTKAGQTLEGAKNAVRPIIEDALTLPEYVTGYPVRERLDERRKGIEEIATSARIVNDFFFGVIWLVRFCARYAED